MKRKGAGKSRAKRGSKKPQPKQVKRGATGRILSAEDALAHSRETLARLLDVVFPQNRQVVEYREWRAKQVAGEQKDRKRRVGKNPQRYRYNYGSTDAVDARAKKAAKDAQADIFPKPVDISRIKGTYQYIWAYQGQYALSAIEAILSLPTKSHFPKDSWGFIANGKTYSKRFSPSDWTGTSFSPVWRQYTGDVYKTNSKKQPRRKGKLREFRTLLQQLNSFRTSTTTSLKHMREDFEVEGRERKQWAELKIITSEIIRDKHGKALKVEQRRKK